MSPGWPRELQQERGVAGAKMPGFRDRLSRAQQRIYDRSNAVSSVRVAPSLALGKAVASLEGALRAGDREQVQRLAQMTADEITRGLKVPPVRIAISGRRPANLRGELHGLYVAGRRGPATIRVWMITAKHGQVVAFRTLLRTLLHEICHHLDYALLALEESFHTKGFYQRESSLFHQAMGAASRWVAWSAEAAAPEHT